MGNCQIIILLILFNSIVSNGQNLVVNGSFEEYKECCKYYGQIDAVKGWFQLYGSSDYFNSCCSYEDFLGVPNNFVGYQTPKHGNAYVGVALFSSKDNRLKKNGYYYREYIHTKLLNTLEKDSLYVIILYYSLADSSKLYTDQISIAFSESRELQYHPQSTNLLIPEFKVNIKVGPEAMDKNNWNKLSFIYEGKGIENYLIIGLFDDDLTLKEYKNNQKRINNENGRHCYYYIDLVSVTKFK